MNFRGGQVVLLLRWPRARPMVWLAAGGLIRKEERLERGFEKFTPDSDAVHRCVGG